MSAIIINGMRTFRRDGIVFSDIHQDRKERPGFTGNRIAVQAGVIPIGCILEREDGSFCSGWIDDLVSCYKDHPTLDHAKSAWLD